MEEETEEEEEEVEVELEEVVVENKEGELKKEVEVNVWRKRDNAVHWNRKNDRIKGTTINVHVWRMRKCTIEMLDEEIV